MGSHGLRSESGVRQPDDAALDDPLFIRAIHRATQVLDVFRTADRPLSLAEIARGAGLDRSAAQRIVHTLRMTGHLRRAEDDRGYLPGIRLLDHGLDYLRLNPLVRRASPVLMELRRNLQERVDLSLFDDLRMVYAARNQSKRETFLATLTGYSVPTYCSSGGLAVLSRLTEARARDIIARSDLRALTPRTPVDPEAIMAAVAEARERGHALCVEQVLMGELALGVAVLDVQGNPVAAIHVVGSLSDWTAEGFAARVAPLASAAARAIAEF